jgi:chaperonin GroES
MKLQPLGDRLIVEVLDEEQETMSGIVLPDTAKEKPQRGRVLAVGPGSRSQETGERVQMEVEEATRSSSPSTGARRSGSARTTF